MSLPGFPATCALSFVLALFLLVNAQPVSGQSRAADSAAILRVVALRAEAIRTRDASVQQGQFAPDAVWINAFGRRRVGPDSIGAFLRGLYADSGYRESRMTREDPVEIWFIRPDVAVAHEYHEREGQRLANGTVISRRIHTTFVLSKEEGRWLVRYQYIADERDPRR